MRLSQLADVREGTCTHAFLHLVPFENIVSQKICFRNTVIQTMILIGLGGMF